MKTILLLRNKEVAGEAIVDDNRFDELSQYRWYMDKCGYARRYVSTGKRGSITRYMHHDVLRTPIGQENLFVVADHINRITLDNRKENLRLCSATQNGFNKMKLRNKSSRMIGVSWHKQNEKWEATLTRNRKKIFLGIYPSERMAANAYRFAKPIIANDKYSLKLAKEVKQWEL